MTPTRCANCGAPSPTPTADEGVFRCDFCKTTFRQPQQRVAAAPGGGGGVVIAVISVVAVLGLAGVAIALVMRSRPDEPSASVPRSNAPLSVATVPTGHKGASPTSASAAAPSKTDGTRPRWATARAYPIGVDVDGDGTEDVMGPTVVIDGANPQLYVTAFDGKTFAPRWRVGPFGAPDNNTEGKLTIAAAGKRFVVLDPKGDAHLYALADGKLIADFPFREENRGMCGPPALEPKVLVRVGKGDFIIDTATATGRPGSPPAWCAGDTYMRRRPSESFNNYSGTQAEYLQPMGWTRDRLEALKPPPKTTLTFALADGPLVVGVAGQKGVSDAMVVGFDERCAIKFQIAGGPLGLVLGARGPKDLAFERFVFAQSQKPTFITALNAKTGDKLWDAELPTGAGRGAERMAITATRVWVTRTSDTYALVQGIDAATGKVLGMAGE